MGLTQKLLRAIGHEVDAKLVFEGNLLAVSIVDSAFIGMGGELKFVGSLPHIEKPGTKLWLDVAAATACFLCGRGKVPLAQQIGRVSRFTQFARQCRQCRIDGQRIVPYASLGCITASQHDRTRWGAYRLVGDCMGKQGATVCHGVEVRSIGRAIEAVGANEIPTELVGEIENDIWFLLFALRAVPGSVLWP